MYLSKEAKLIKFPRTLDYEENLLQDCLVGTIKSIKSTISILTLVLTFVFIGEVFGRNILINFVIRAVFNLIVFVIGSECYDQTCE